jgi:TetR/AcrR family transcriptional regulator, regulator of cefoperazone and chloramphenicol sensitivity
MARYNTKRSRPASSKKGEADSQTTRDRLLEAAGQVFAEKGFSGATGKEIAELAGTNSAAINYYFGGVDELYSAVIQEAKNRLVRTEDVIAAVAGKTDAREKGEAILRLMVRGITSPAISSWAIRVLGREIVSPSSALEPMWKDVRFRIGIARGIVAELMGLPEDHPAVTRGIISVIGPCLMLLIYDRRLFRRLFPDFGFSTEDSEAIAQQFMQFATAGLAAVGKDVREQA